MTKKERVLTILKEYQKTGLHSFDGAKYYHRFSAYVNFLRNDGYRIVSIPEKRGKDWGVRYKLIG